MSVPARRRDRSGLTLVEVLVVITIIALLIALLIPAVNGAREASRKTTCNSNLRQIAMASVAHLELQGTFPSSGYGTMSGDQISGNRGFHERQGGSWLYNILPYIDLGHLRDVGSNQVAGTCPPVYRCPTTFSSRSTRQGVNSYAGSRGTIDTRFPSKGGAYGGTNHNPAPVRSPDADGQVVHVSTMEGYAADKQEIFRQQYPGYPHALGNLPYAPGSLKDGTFGVVCYPITGVIAPWGRVRADDVTDGMSRTFLAGERYDDYSETEVEGGSLSQGWTKAGYVTTRFTISPPLCALNWKKKTGWEFDYQHDNFGARHADSYGMVMCDGSVRQVAFTIDPAIFRDSGTRNGYNDTSMGSVDD